MSSLERKAETDTGTRLGLALLAYMLGVTLIITLLPFRFEWPDGVHVRIIGGWVDVVANVLLFVPLGFLYRLVMPRERWGSLPFVLCVGAALSLAIETVQLFEPARNAAVSDVLANTCGMGLGALGFRHIARVPRVQGRLTAWLALELRSALPCYVAYLALIVGAPLLEHAGAWHFQWGFPWNASDRLEILRLLELGAAFTLAGYMAAEIRGRTATRYDESLRHLIAWGVGLALAVEAVRGFDPGSGASLARGALLAAATVYGGWLYYLQRTHVVQHLTGPASMR